MKKAVAVLLVIGLFAGTGMAATGEWEEVEGNWTVIPQIWPSPSPQATGIIATSIRDSSDQFIDPSQCETVEAFSILDGEQQPMMPFEGDKTYITARQFPSASGPVLLNATIRGKGCEGFEDGKDSWELDIPLYNNISVDIVNDTSSIRFAEENTYRFRVEATTPQGEVEDTTTMEWFAFNDTSYLSPFITAPEEMSGEMTYENGSYRGAITLPPASGQVVLGFMAEGTEKGYVNATGGEGVLLEVNDSLEGDLSIEAGNGCTANISACEKGASLDLFFDTTSSQADDVQFRVTVGTEDIAAFGGDQLVNESRWTGNSGVTIPGDLDTSQHGNVMDVVATATNSLDNTSDSMTVELHTLGLSASTNTKRIVQGAGIELQVYPEKRYSRSLYPLDRVQSVDITVRGPDGSVMHSASMTGNGLDQYRSVTGTGFLYPLQMPENATTGEYTFQTVVSSIYGEQKTASSVFQVVNPTSICDESIGSICIEKSSVNTTYTTAGSQQLQIPIQSLSRNPIRVSYTTNGSIQALLGSGTATVTSSSAAINLPLQTSRAINGNYTGNITLQVDNDSITLPADVSIQVPPELYEIRLTNVPGSVVSGGSLSFNLVVENTGNTTIRAVQVAVDQLGIDKTVENGIPLQSGGTTTVGMDVTVPLSPGSYTGNQSLTVRTVTAKGNERTAILSFDVVEDITDNLRSLVVDTRSLDNQVQDMADSLPQGTASNIRSDLGRLEDTLQDAQQAWEIGEYNTARQRYQEAQSMKQEIESQLANPQPPETSEQETGDGGFSLDVSGTAVLAFLATLIVILAPIIYFAFFQERK